MASTIDYSNYSYTELLDARQSINEQASPDNAAELDRLLAAYQHSPVEPETKPESEPEPVQCKTCEVIFTGKTGEYFSIWIVNLLLSIVTLGIYSAWAKVRTNRYFYGHTAVDGHRFSYLANPLQILKGRIIAVVLFVTYMLLSTFSPVASAVLALVLFFVSPWLICKSLNFSLKMSAYRNVRFGFTGKYLEALLVFILFPILTMFSLYLALPWALKQMDDFIVTNTTYGNKKFTAGLRNSKYFIAGYAAAFTGVVIAIVGITAFGISVVNGIDRSDGAASAMVMLGFFAIYIAIFAICSSIYHALIRNHIYQVTQLEGAASFDSDVSIGGLLALRVTNLLAVIFSLGLALPWVKVRTAAFYAMHTKVIVLPGITSIVASPEQTASSTADEVANAFDLDISLG